MIHLSYTNTDELDLELVSKALLEGQVSTAGKYTEKFEKRCAYFLAVPPKQVLATNSGSSALYYALVDAGACKGEVVAMPTLTFAATANAVLKTGATVLLCDVDRDTWNLKTSHAAADIVLGVDLYGNLCKGNLDVIDAAESFGTRYPDGNSNIAYSFNGNKVFTTGGGGLYVAKKESIAKTMASQGKIGNDDHLLDSWNDRMPSLNAALGLSQIKKISQFLITKDMIFNTYKAGLDGIVKLQEKTVYGNHLWLVSGTFDFGIDIKWLQKELLKKGIETRRVFKPIHLYAKHDRVKARYEYKNAEEIYHHGLCLPSSTDMTVKQAEFVVDTIRGILNA